MTLHSCAIEDKLVAVRLAGFKDHNLCFTEVDYELAELHEISRARSVAATMAIVGRPILCLNLRLSPSSAIHRAKEQGDHPFFNLKLQLYRLEAKKWSQSYRSSASFHQMQALGRTLRKGVQLQPRLAEAACRVTTSAASESPAAASAASSQKGAVSREFQVQSHPHSLSDRPCHLWHFCWP